MDFIERETGKPVLQSDRGIVSLTVINPEAPSERTLRSIVPDFSTDAGHLGLYGGIERGKSVQVCPPRRRSCCRKSTRSPGGLRRPPFQPQAALIVSCGGRKQMLGPQIGNEISRLTGAFAHPPAAGRFSVVWRNRPAERAGRLHPQPVSQHDLRRAAAG